MSSPSRSKSYILNPRSTGQATLSLAVLVGGTAVLIGLTLTFLTISFINTTAGFQSGNLALTVASGGAEDALLRLARNKELTASYNLTIDGSTAVVTIQPGSPPDRVLITSEATVVNSQRKIAVYVSVDEVTGRVSVILWRQVAL